MRVGRRIYLEPDPPLSGSRKGSIKSTLHDEDILTLPLFDVSHS